MIVAKDISSLDASRHNMVEGSWWREPCFPGHIINIYLALRPYLLRYLLVGKINVFKMFNLSSGNYLFRLKTPGFKIKKNETN